jgi:catechol 2,3-dioxygenase-like lactoylglutathione lyase family enzyme
MLKELHAVLPAADIQRARSFYHEKLGLEPDEERPGSLVYHPVQGSAFEIYETDDVGTVGTSQMAWLTDDLDSEMEQLRARGVVFEKLDVPGVKTAEGIARMSDARAAWFRDTEGNLLCITQLASGPTAALKREGAGPSRLRDAELTLPGFGRLPVWIPGLPPESLTGIPAV